MTPTQEARLDRLLAKYDQLIEERKQATAHRLELAPPSGGYRTLTNAAPPPGGFQPPKEHNA